jgi:hypothetical protein
MNKHNVDRIGRMGTVKLIGKGLAFRNKIMMIQNIMSL